LIGAAANGGSSIGAAANGGSAAACRCSPVNPCCDAGSGASAAGAGGIKAADGGGGGGAGTPVGGIGAAGAGSSDPGVCAGNACPAAYPCQPLGASYTCRGQFAEWPMPDTTGSAKVSTTTFRSSVDGETLTDSVTGLMWQATIPTAAPGCASGQAMPSTDQANSDGTCTFSEAKSYCDALTVGGHDDWRMPTKIEMESVVDFSVVRNMGTGFATAVNFNAESLEPGIRVNNMNVFGYWTSSPCLGPEGGAWTLEAGLGLARCSSGGALNVRCVR
jgi:hypothetical protein